MKCRSRILPQDLSTIMVWLVLLFAGLPGFLAAENEPLNLMVAPLTFTRPDGWSWKAPAETYAAAGLLSVPSQDQKFRTEVTFVGATAVGKEIVDKFWKRRFPEADQRDLETVRWHGTDVVLFTLQGSYQIKAPKVIHADAKMVGAIIPVGPKRFIHVRIFGAKKDVDAALSTFKRMIEDALKKEEAE